MTYNSIKPAYDSQMQSKYLEFRHICENMLGLEMGWNPEIPSNSTLTLVQWEAALDHLTNMYDTMSAERDGLRRVRLDEINTMIDQMSNIIPKMNYSGHTPKESKWVVELRNAAIKAEPICLSPFWREVEGVLDVIGGHILRLRSKSHVLTTFKL
jgi:hypothetical protein